MKKNDLPYKVETMRNENHTDSMLIKGSKELQQGNDMLEKSEATHRQAKEYQKLAIQVLELLNESGEKTDKIRDILHLIKEFTGFEAVGIRLREGEDFPYYETYGFPADFIEAERHLCERDQCGNVIRDSDGNPSLECMCGNIIRSRTNPSLPFFTEGGSFWTNCTTKLLASTTEEDRQAHTRNRCNGEGYESVALTPLKNGNEIVGLLQLNDRRKGMFRAEMIKLFEGIGSSIGIALARKQSEEQIHNLNKELQRKIKELEGVNKDLESFSYSVSHDLRVPLRAIDGFSKILVEDYHDKLDDEGKRLLNIVRDNTDKMGLLIDDLLSFSRIGRKEIVLSEFNIGDLMSAVIEELKPSTVGRNIKFEIKPLPHAYGDQAMIRQVSINLLSNAIKFTRPRKTAFIEVGAEIEEDQNIYYVKDNGVGFDMQYVDNLFGIFQRLHSQEKFDGTGIGLAIVQRVIHRHGGQVWTKAKVDKGATFYFSLPKSK